MSQETPDEPATRLEKALRGDREAFDSLCEWLLPAVYRYAVGRVGDRAVAEEITSDAFVVMIQKMSTLPPADAAVLAWIRGVVRHRCIDWIRRQQVSRRVTTQLQQQLDTSSGSLSEPPSERIEQDEQRKAVFGVLDELSDIHRCVLELRYFDGLDLDGVAEALGCSRSAANSTLYRARDAFRIAAQAAGLAETTSPLQKASMEGMA